MGQLQDDLTRETVAELLGRPLQRDESIVEAHSRRAFARLRREMPELNLRQAMVPEGAEALENPRGTAPGLWVNRCAGTTVTISQPSANGGEVISNVIRTGMPQPSEFLVFNTRRPMFCRYSRAPGIDAAVRFRMDQPATIFSDSMDAPRRFSSRGPNCRLTPDAADGRERELLKPYPLAVPTGQFSTAAIASLSADGSGRDRATLRGALALLSQGRLRSRRHGIAAACDQAHPSSSKFW